MCVSFCCTKESAVTHGLFIFKKNNDYTLNSKLSVHEKNKIKSLPWVSEFFLWVKNADQRVGKGTVWNEFADLPSVDHSVSKY